MKTLTKQQKAYAVITFGAAMGLIASFFQLLEKLTLLKDPQTPLSCNLSAIFNCSNILNAPQSSVFGFPNSLLCIILFVLALTAGLIGLYGAKIHKNLRFIFQGLALFTVGFGLWYFWQSIFNIGTICVYCIFCFGGVLLVNAGWFRLNYADYPLSNKTKAWLDKAVARGADIFFWCLIGLIIILEAIVKFA